VEHSEARRFADSWAAAWNAHDLERILAHFTDDVMFQSPVAARIVPGSDGVVRGIDALRSYWAEGLKLLPDLHFEVVEVYTGIDTVVINYRNQAGQLVNEILVFDGDRVRAGNATYGPPPA
jgi:ketosteroid isomerase-like protein